MKRHQVMCSPLDLGTAYADQKYCSSEVIQESFSMRVFPGGTCTAIPSEAGAYFKNNNSSKGGAFYIYVPDDFKASGTAFINNYADDIGGGIFLRSEDLKPDHDIFSYFLLEGCWFVGNGAGDGGGLYQDSENYGFSIHSSVFEENYAGESENPTFGLI